MYTRVRLNPYDDDVAAAFKAAREIPREGLTEWREAIRRHLRPSPGMTVVDIGAGTGAYSAAFVEWFDAHVVAVEPSDAMRSRIPQTAASEVLAGNAMSLPLPDDTADERGSLSSSTTFRISPRLRERSAACCVPALPF